MTIQGLLIALAVGCVTSAGCIDAKMRRIPNALSGAVCAIGCVLSAIQGPEVLFAALLVAVAVAAVLLGVRACLGNGSLGMGDIKMLAACAIVTGPSGALSLLLTAFCAACVHILVRSIHRRKMPREAFAFGPYIAIGLAVVALPSAMWA